MAYFLFVFYCLSCRRRSLFASAFNPPLISYPARGSTAQWTGYALNAAIGMQVFLGALTTAISAATSGRQASDLYLPLRPLLPPFFLAVRDAMHSHGINILLMIDFDRNRRTWFVTLFPSFPFIPLFLNMCIYNIAGRPGTIFLPPCRR